MNEAPVCPARQSAERMALLQPYAKQGYTPGCTANWRCASCNRSWTITDTEQGHIGCIRKF